MNENGKKKREWVKTAAIIFLSVLLVLTFFSNTIQNYSLPEVATQYVQSGTITAKIRGTGVVESGDPYNVEVKESRKVADVAVRVGDTVQKGDVLLYLEDSESDELKEARKTLETLQKAVETARDAYNQSLMSADVQASDIQTANKGIPTSSFRQQITNYQNSIEAAKQEMAPFETRSAELTQAIADYKKQVEYDSTLQANADVYYKAAEKARDEAKAAYDSISDGDAGKAEAKTKWDNAQKTYESTQIEYFKHRDIIISLNNSINAFEIELYNVQRSLEAATKKKTDAEAELTKLVGSIGKVYEIEGKLDAISDAQKAVDDQQKIVDELTSKAVNATVTADIAGTVTALNVTAGQTTSAATPVAVLQPEGKGYTMSFSVTNEQAKRLAVGDRADLVNAWRYEDVNVVLSSIKPDKTDPGQKKQLTFDVSGSVTAGQTLNVSVGQKSANFDYIVPNSAIREDNNGKFILIVETKSSPLGNRYIASRVDVEVLASDDTQSAISAALYGYEYVITTSTKPVEAGKLVRLSDNN